MKPLLLLPSKNPTRALPPPHSSVSPPPPPPSPSDISYLAKLINSHPLKGVEGLLHRQLPLLSSTPLLIPSLLGRLVSSHSSSPKLLRLFLFSLSHLPFPPSPSSLHSLLLSLSRSRHFPHALRLLSNPSLLRHHPSLLTPHSLSLLLSPHAKFHSFDATSTYFHSLKQIYLDAGVAFDVHHFNAYIRAYASLGRMAEARAVFNRLHGLFPPNSRTLNTLLLGFKKSGNILAFDLFYNEMLVRGFRPDAVTYNIRIDAYCKKNRFLEATGVFEEMERKGFAPTVETFTTLIHGAGIAKNPFRAWRVFDEIGERGLVKDKGAYNALIGALVRVGDLKGGLDIMNEMEEKGIAADDVSYYTMFCGSKKAGDLDGVCQVYKKMVERNYVPRVRTVMLLMRYFCESRRSDLGLGLWDYLVDKGCCPHRHALDLLIIALCCSKKAGVAFECFKQMVERERRPSERSFAALAGAFGWLKDKEKLDELKMMRKKLESLGPLQHADYDEEEC